MKRVALAAIAAGLLAHGASAAPGRVIQGDNRLGSYAVKTNGTLGGAIAAFGKPSLHHNQVGCRARWPGLALRIDFYNLGGKDPCTPAGGFFAEALATGRGWHTANGLKIGDGVSRARRLFPRAQTHGSRLWLVVRRSPFGTGGFYAGLAATSAHGRVTGFVVSYPAGGD
jgi:hypothetical protein